MERVERILVLGSTLTALAVVRAAQALGIQPVLVDTRRGVAFDSRHPIVHCWPNADDATVLRRLSEIARESRAALIADNDAWLRFIVRHRALLQTLFAVIVHPDSAAIECCLDKSQFLAWCDARGIAAPRHYPLEEAAALQPSAERPLLLRPETTRHGAGLDVPKAVEVRSREQLDHWLGRFAAVAVRPSIAQSLLRPGIRQYSVGIARNADGQMRVMVAEKLRSYPEQCAGGTYVVLSSQVEVQTLAARAIEALDYFGIAEVEVMRDDRSGECFLIEINARPWVQFGLAQAAGLNLLGFVLGLDRTQGAAPAANAWRWLNFEADAYICLSRDVGAVRAGRLPLGDYLRSVFRANSFAVWAIRDQRPFWRGTWRSLRQRLSR